MDDIFIPIRSTRSVLPVMPCTASVARYDVRLTRVLPVMMTNPYCLSIYFFPKSLDVSFVKHQFQHGHHAFTNALLIVSMPLR